MTMPISEEFLIPILQNMIKFPTENPEGRTKELVDYLFSIFQDKRFRKKIISYMKEEVELHNFVVEIGSGKEKIVLCGHLDTVPAGSTKNWNYNPFSAIVEDGKVYGRGSVDMKGGLASLIGVMFELLNYPEFLEHYTVVLACTADEEAGMSGAETIEKTGIMEGAILLVIAEATDMNIGIAEKGVVWANLTVHGKQAHGSMPDQGINAIELASSLFSQLHGALANDLVSQVLGKSTLNIGTISGGTKINVVPNKVELELDYRLIPEENMDSLIEKLKNLTLSSGNYEIEITNALPSLQTKITPFHDKLAKLTGTEKIGLTYGTDAAKLLSNNKTIPFVIFGPGATTMLHQDNEHVPIAQVVKVAEILLQALLETYN